MNEVFFKKNCYEIIAEYNAKLFGITLTLTIRKNEYRVHLCKG